MWQVLVLIFNSTNQLIQRFRVLIAIVSLAGIALAILYLFVIYPMYINDQFQKKFNQETELLCESARTLGAKISKEECKEAGLVAKELIELRVADHTQYAECLAYVLGKLNRVKKITMSCNLVDIYKLTIEQLNILEKRIKLHKAAK